MSRERTRNESRNIRGVPQCIKHYLASAVRAEIQRVEDVPDAGAVRRQIDVGIKSFQRPR